MAWPLGNRKHACTSDHCMWTPFIGLTICTNELDCVCLVFKEARGIKTKRSFAVMHTADSESQRTDRPVVVQFVDVSTSHSFTSTMG